MQKINLSLISISTTIRFLLSKSNFSNQKLFSLIFSTSSSWPRTNLNLLRTRFWSSSISVKYWWSLKMSILLTSSTKLIKVLEITWIISQKSNRWKSCSSENPKVSISSAKREFTSKLKRATKFSAELVVVTCTSMSSSISTLTKKLKKLREKAL